jgi:hypothetical protein
MIAKAQMSFFTVTANFDMSAHSELEVKTFIHWENAYQFAEEQRIEFLNQIPNNGVIDEDDTMIEVGTKDNLYYYYGVSQNGENFVTIRVIEDTFTDEKEGVLKC